MYRLKAVKKVLDFLIFKKGLKRFSFGLAFRIALRLKLKFTIGLSLEQSIEY